MKKISRKEVAWISGIFIFLFIFINSTRVQAEPKDYYFPEVKIEINIAGDGSFAFDEYRTYEFQGSFSWANLWIPLRVSRQGYEYNIFVEDFKILDERGFPLRKETFRSRDRLEAKWYYQASNERRTFHIHYRVRSGIFSYPDVSELYWQVVGQDWDKPTRYLTVNVHLPDAVSDKNDILVYGHGPLSGNSEIIDNKSARFTAVDLPSFQPVEIRMIWPAGLVNGILSNRYTRSSIQQEEARFVQETIEEAQDEIVRTRQAEAKSQEEQFKEQARKKILLYAWMTWLIIAPILWLYFYVKSWKKVGKDYHFDDIPPYYRELPSNLSPALVEILIREGNPITPASFTATLFDLARRGYIEMDDRLEETKGLFGTKQEYKTTITCQKDFMDDPQLLLYEKDFLRLVFVSVGGQAPQRGASLKLDDLKKYFEKKPQTFQKWYKEWMNKVQTESKKFQFIEPASIKMRNIFMAATIPVAFLTLNPVLIVLSAILIPKIKRRARQWARENELWRALERFLDDFSDFKELPPEAYKLWEHYLVFGIIFGNAKKILKALPIVLKDERAAAPAWYRGFSTAAFISSTGRIQSMIKSIEHMSTSIQHASTSAAHYSSGHGGGFSRGGGGGGGGGGGRAG